ncbi:unnamed protein product [Arctogadus glacialis]
MEEMEGWKDMSETGSFLCVSALAGLRLHRLLLAFRQTSWLRAAPSCSSRRFTTHHVPGTTATSAATVRASVMRWISRSVWETRSAAWNAHVEAPLSALAAAVRLGAGRARRATPPRPVPSCAVQEVEDVAAAYGGPGPRRLFSWGRAVGTSPGRGPPARCPGWLSSALWSRTPLGERTTAMTGSTRPSAASQAWNTHSP